MSSQRTLPIQPQPSDRRNACPGLSRMVMARDGAIARIKLPLGRLSADQAFALADIAAQFGPGAVELSIRSNIQLRAIAPDRWEKAVTALYDAGLGAANPAADDIRNVMVSPAAGIDSGQSCDVAPLARDLLAMLERNPVWHALSPKFSFQIDGGENCAMVAHPGDLWLSASDDGQHFAFGLASSPDGPALGRIEAGNALPFIEAVLRLFLARAPNGVARMKQLFETFPQARFLDELIANLPFPVEQPGDWRRRQPDPFAHLGPGPQTGGRFYIGAMPLLGRLDVAQLRALAALARDTNGGEIRLTPWQGVILPHIDAEDCEDIVRQLHVLGLATDPNAPQSRLRACTGLKGCASAFADTQADARQLAGLLGNGTGAVHLTGCAKSCAALAPLPRTLLARAPGRYDVFFAGKTGPSRFGQLLAMDITIEEAARLLNSQEQRS